MSEPEKPNLQAELARGTRAQAVMNDPIYREAWDAVERGIVEHWKAAPIQDIDGQHKLRLMLKILKDVRGYLEETMKTGKLAAIQISEEKTRMARLKEFAAKGFRR